MPSIGQTWVLASIGAVVEMGVLSTLKRLLMGSNPTIANGLWFQGDYIFTFTPALVIKRMGCLSS
jgi:hypothetical protein